MAMIPQPFEQVLALVEHQNALGLSTWWEVVYHNSKNWCVSYPSNTFKNGERVLKWVYCKDVLPKENS